MDFYGENYNEPLQIFVVVYLSFCNLMGRVYWFLGRKKELTMFPLYLFFLSGGETNSTIPFFHQVNLLFLSRGRNQLYYSIISSNKISLNTTETFFSAFSLIHYIENILGPIHKIRLIYKGYYRENCWKPKEFIWTFCREFCS